MIILPKIMSRIYIQDMDPVEISDAWAGVVYKKPGEQRLTV